MIKAALLRLKKAKADHRKFRNAYTAEKVTEAKRIVTKLHLRATVVQQQNN